MNTGPQPSPQRRWYRRPWPWFALIALLLTAWLARSLILGPLVAHAVAGAIADATGGPASVARAGGGFLHDVHLTGVQAGSGPGPAWQVRAGRVDAHYALGLLRGDLTALRRIVVTGLEIDATLPPSSSPAGSWPPLLEYLPATLPEVQAEGNMRIRAAGSVVDIDGFSVSLDREHIVLAARQVRVAGREMTLPACELRRSASDTLELAAPVRLDLPWLPIPLWCDTLQVVLGQQLQEVHGAGRLAGGSWQVVAKAASTRLRLHGVDLVELGLLPSGHGAILADAEVEQVATGWAVRDLRLTGAGAEVRASAVITSDPWRAQDVVAEASLELAKLPGMQRVQGRLHGTLRGTAQLQPGRWRDSELTVAIRGDEVVWSDVPCTPLAATLRLDQGRLSIEELAFAWGGFAASAMTVPSLPATDRQAPADGWQLHIPPTRCAGGIVSGDVTLATTGTLAGQVVLDGVPLAQLPGLSAVRHVRGSASGRLELAGTLLRPQWRGEVEIAGLEVKVSPDIPTLADGRARLTYADQVIVVESMHGDLGGSPAEITGRVTLGAGPPRIDLTCTGSNLLLTQRQDVRVRADLALRLSGTVDDLLLSGRMRVVNALITPELDVTGGAGVGAGDGRLVLFEIPDPPWSRMRFDVAIDAVAASGEADTGVRIATRWGRGRCDLDLHLRGTGAAPEPEGRVILREGIATLPFSTLKVTHGEVIFPSGDPFQPRVTIIAAARIRQYDIQVQVTGTLDQPVVRVSSSGLDEQEATFLLTTGSTPRELQDEAGQRAAIGRIGTWLGQETWRSIEGPEDYDAGPSLAERVSVYWGREITAEGRDTIDGEVELTTPGSDQAVLLYGQRDRYDQYNAGVILRLYWGGEDQ